VSASRNVTKNVTKSRTKDKSKDKSRFLKKHILIDRDLFREVALIAAYRYGSPVRTIYLVINDALKEYVERHRVR